MPLSQPVPARRLTFRPPSTPFYNQGTNASYTVSRNCHNVTDVTRPASVHFSRPGELMPTNPRLVTVRQAMRTLSELADDAELLADVARLVVREGMQGDYHLAAQRLDQTVEAGAKVQRRVLLVAAYRRSMSTWPGVPEVNEGDDEHCLSA